MAQVLMITNDEQESQHALSIGPVISQNPRMRAIYDMVSRVAQTNATVLITGETGTGKELIANSLHAQSPRRKGPFVAVNCAALPNDLIESELFGHERGTFTGAYQRHIGKFEQADGGTLFLDEIGSLPVHQQAKLLRVIQSRLVDRIGSIRPTPVDIRIVAATNEPISALVQKKLFREDLYYRLNVVSVDLPPLRERRGDIPLLANYFLANLSATVGRHLELTDEAMACLVQYEWPGNVRELENLIDRLIVVIHRKLKKIGICHLRKINFNVHNVKDESSRDVGSLFDISDINEAKNAFEERFIINALKRNNWNHTKTAKDICIHRNTLIMKIEKFNIRGASDE